VRTYRSGKGKQMKNKYLSIVILLIINLMWIVPCAIKYNEDYLAEPTTEIIETEITEVHIEESTEVEVAEPIEEVKFYDVPLSEELQLHIFAECDKYNIAPSIIIAMIERESNYDASGIGDSGNSYGLMQVQPQWSEIKAIMEELGCTDLLDPYQNVSVGIRWVAQIRDANTDIYWVLMRYNGGVTHANNGCATGNYSDYAIYIVERATELDKEIE
jgi:hypothetical protein